MSCPTHRYERASAIITSNRSLRDCPTMLAGNEALTTAILDRLLHHCHVLSTDGASYLLRHLERELSEGQRGRRAPAPPEGAEAQPEPLEPGPAITTGARGWVSPNCAKLDVT